ncbi:sensor histidine kinase [Paenibacillus eucommiae]|uniref:Two-component system sensor histidine kinase YesM n=1 Tax=Paenibacillus eucommiae TaxID=1355755 RepID=A0ABS4IUT5_9BACL|nr:sensor histidine kinase [Paenibacillus eucommiae]MBP1990751.1 two-component system sensor histidine kinase YesM [Paenibacillus eucommiae]
MKLFRIHSVTIFPKLVVTFLLVVVPLYLVSLAANESGAQGVKDEVERSLVSRVHFYLSSFDAEFKRIIQMRNEYVFDSDLQEISVIAPAMTDFQFSQSVSRIREKLRLLKVSSLYVQNVEVHIPSLHKTISTTGFVDNIPEQELDLLQQSSGTLDTSILNREEQYFIGGVYPLPTMSSAEAIYLMKVQLSREKIQQSLIEINDSLKGGVILLDNGGSWSISSKDESAFAAELQAFSEVVPQPGSMNTETILQGSRTVKYEGKKFLVIFERFSTLNTTLLVYVPEEEIIGAIKKSRTWLWIVSATSIVVVVVFSYWIYRLIHQPIRRMVMAFRRVEKGDLGITINHKQEDEFGYMYMQFNAMVSRLQVLIHEVYEQTIRTQRAELKQLQSQINPHFLYNSYFVLYQMAQLRDIDNVINLTKHLGEYFRYITRSAIDDVPLSMELRHTYAFVEIQMLRFGKRMSTHYGEIPAVCEEIYVPKLIIQPIIENTYEHALRDKKSGGLVQIEIVLQQPEHITIVIEDNGDKITDEDIQALKRQLEQTDGINETTGMLNVHRRLLLKFGKPYGLTLYRAAIGGLGVHITIPLRPPNSKEEANV